MQHLVSQRVESPSLRGLPLAEQSAIFAMSSNGMCHTAAFSDSHRLLDYKRNEKGQGFPRKNEGC